MPTTKVVVKLVGRSILALAGDQPSQKYIFDAGVRMAIRAGALAPKDTGRGAASIAPTPAWDDSTAVNVTWSNQYPYLIFQEDGTKYVPARHFLRDAFESYIHT